MCVGLTRADRIFYSAAAGPGILVVYIKWVGGAN